LFLTEVFLFPVFGAIQYGSHKPETVITSVAKTTYFTIQTSINVLENVGIALKSSTYVILAAVKTTSGFGRERDVILVIWHRSIPHVVVSSFAEFLGTQNRQLGI